MEGDAATSANHRQRDHDNPRGHPQENGRTRLPGSGLDLPGVTRGHPLSECPHTFPRWSSHQIGLERRWATGDPDQLSQESLKAAERVKPRSMNFRTPNYDTNTFRGWAGRERCLSQNWRTEILASLGDHWGWDVILMKGPPCSRDMSPEQDVLSGARLFVARKQVCQLQPPFAPLKLQHSDKPKHTKANQK